MMETIADRRDFQTVFTFNQPIAIRDLPRARTRFGIYAQASVALTILPKSPGQEGGK
jgi:hypothetical protein